jgi:hypothetical protein
MKCGVTGDCLFWVHVFKAIGALPAELQIPDYRKREGSVNSMERLRGCIEETGRAELVASCQPSAVSHQPAGKSSQPSAVSRQPEAESRKLIADSNIATGDVLLFANGMSGVHCGLVVRETPPHFVHLSQNGLTEEPLNQEHWLASLAFIYRLMEPAPSHQPSAISDQPDLRQPDLRADSRELKAESSALLDAIIEARS